MPQGMTGFGRAGADHARGAVTVEVKSVNNRFLKISLRVPDALAELEAELEAQIRGVLARGSVHASVNVGGDRPDKCYSLNEELIRQWVPRLKALAQETGEQPPALKDIIAMTGAVLEQSEPLQPDEALFAAVRQSLAKALVALREMREREGAALRQDLDARVANVARLTAQVESRAPQVVHEYRARLKARIDKLLADSNLRLDDSTLARETALLADRSDVTEETTRLQHHCAQFLKVIAGGGEVGRRLDFIAQEMLRETNTIASKAGDAELAGVAVEMKSEIEKIKEQVQNLE